MWLISEFRVPAGAYGHAVAAPLVAFLYWSFGLLTGLRQRSLPDHAGALSAAGWILEDHRCHLGGLLISQLWRRSQE